MALTLTNFLEGFFSPDNLVKLRKYCGNEKLTGKMRIGEAIEVLISCTNSYFLEDFPFLPECVDHNRNLRADHDHGAWTERFIFKDGGIFLAVEVEFYGQGDYDNEDLPMYEVKPRTITTVVYDTI